MTAFSGGGEITGQSTRNVPALVFDARNRRNAALRLTLHDLLQLHLQGLDGPGWVVTGPALYPVDGQPALRHGGHVVILQIDDAVGVLDHGAVVTGGGGQIANIMYFIIC